ncbi:MAG TPA: hypothetical protein PKZ67_11100 [Accumulibacter sp.]|uniref:Outer membrane protein assembly factor BamE n=2 Tax=Candidatus Accumulibacter TaxID=327159 RepID=A0A080MHI8_9PROT|nr:MULTISPECIES: hypothetical protein [Candidatus Accumulibacter]KFB76699.1 MAG: hypothetical protein AW06_002175 [Candidatus Accumulibacter cognatus]MBL8400448.1 hypothetical protein [Accumulibacter sp.]MBN8518620.1 hypothetical protein [Accumulibacter sp.]MBO3710485.1 hypothetical protein [Accumulibacter sp.]MCC2868582.1 hypothetical protein [Candidatus Accumulibacter phosphatis]
MIAGLPLSGGGRPSQGARRHAAAARIISTREGVYDPDTDQETQETPSMPNKALFRSFGRLTVAAFVVLLAGCAGGPVGTWPGDAQSTQTEQALPVRIGYACCNLHYSGDWISDSNYTQLSFIPVGTPITVKKIDRYRYRAYVDVAGRPMRMGLDYGRGQETTEQWVNKVVVLDDPRTRLATFPPLIREAIWLGRVMRGMTREQVIMAAGYPQSDETPWLDVLYWRYWWASSGPYYVYWSRNKEVTRIEGSPEILSQVTYRGE